MNSSSLPLSISLLVDEDGHVGKRFKKANDSDFYGHGLFELEKMFSMNTFDRNIPERFRPRKAQRPKPEEHSFSEVCHNLRVYVSSLEDHIADRNGKMAEFMELRKNGQLGIDVLAIRNRLDFIFCIHQLIWKVRSLRDNVWDNDIETHFEEYGFETEQKIIDIQMEIRVIEGALQSNTLETFTFSDLFKLCQRYQSLYNSVWGMILEIPTNTREQVDAILRSMEDDEEDASITERREALLEEDVVDFARQLMFM